jgi:hypothetical protein
MSLFRRTRKRRLLQGLTDAKDVRQGWQKGHMRRRQFGYGEGPTGPLDDGRGTDHVAAHEKRPGYMFLGALKGRTYG